MGIVAPAVLTTIAGYVTIHGTRTGDYDSLLTLFTTGFILFYFLYLEESSQKYFWLTIIMIIAAALTKGVQGMIFLPVLLVYTLLKRQMVSLLKKPQTYLGIGLFLFIVIGYYVLREQYNPGYIKAVITNELGSRYNTVTEGHNGNGWSNFNLLVDTYFTSWYQLVIPGVIFGFYSKKKWMKPLVIYISAVFLFYFLVISNAKTQIPWYMMPLYPLLAILTASFICSAFHIISELSITEKKHPSAIAAYIFLIFIFITPYARVYNFAMGNVVDQNIAEEERDMSALMYNVLHKNDNIDGYTIVNEYFNQSINWYNHAFTWNHIPVHYESKEKLTNGLVVVAYMKDTKQYLHEHYDLQLVRTIKKVDVYRITGLKTP